MCIQTQKTIADEDRMKFESDELYLKSFEEMQKLFSHIKKLAHDNPHVYCLRLYVEKNNKTAQNAYRSVGMKEAHYLMYECISNKKMDLS